MNHCSFPIYAKYWKYFTPVLLHNNDNTREFLGNTNNAKMINFCTLYANYFIKKKKKVITLLNSLAI